LHIIIADFETSTFLSRKITLNTLILSSLQRSRSFPSAPTLTAKVSNIPDTAKLLAMFFIPKDKKGIEHCHCREKNTSTFLFRDNNSMPYTYIPSLTKRESTYKKCLREE